MDRGIEVFATHGVVENVFPLTFQHRNLLDKDAFEFYLQHREPFRKLEDVVRDGGAALTIDDSTRAAADAALMARAYRHEVTLFVNPENIVHSSDYPLCHLNKVLDDIRVPLCFDSIELTDLSFSGKNVFRKRFKEKMNRRYPDTERLAYVAALADQANAAMDPLPTYLKSLSIEDLRMLLGTGVSIQNHGWSHEHYANLTADEARSNTMRARAWIRDTLKYDPRLFAVPFGDVWPTGTIADVCDLWFLLLSKERQGLLCDRVVNRRKLTINEGHI
jgi:hypothetical protein